MNCTSATASGISLAGIFGLDNERHQILNAFLGNTFSVLYDAGNDLWNARVSNFGRDYVLGGAYQGAWMTSRFMGVGGRAGYVAAKGVVGAVTVVVANGIAPGLEAAEPLGWLKLGFDAVVFAGSAAYCAVH